MYKIAILGCENSHADMFLDIIKNEKIDDVEVVGVYSYDSNAAERVSKKYGIPIAQSYDEFVGKIDGLIITARHGDHHYKYAKPYLDSKIPLFIDKPITISEKEAVEFMSILKENHIPAVGGSMCVFADHVTELKNAIAKGEHGKVIGGFLRAPLKSDSEHGGFYFYAQHMVQITCEIFGYFPNSVIATQNGQTVTVITKYDGFDVCGTYDDIDPAPIYFASVNFKNKIVGSEFWLGAAGSREFRTFYDILKGKEQHQSYDEMFASVFVMNAIERSLTNRQEERVLRADEIAI